MVTDSSAAPGATRITVGYFSHSVLLAVAPQTGALVAAELEVHARPVASSPAQFTSQRDGELAVALTSPDNVLAYRFSPDNPLGTLLDVSIVGSVDRGLVHPRVLQDGRAGGSE